MRNARPRDKVLVIPDDVSRRKFGNVDGAWDTLNSSSFLPPIDPRYLPCCGVFIFLDFFLLEQCAPLLSPKHAIRGMIIPQLTNGDRKSVV